MSSENPYVIPAPDSFFFLSEYAYEIKSSQSTELTWQAACFDGNLEGQVSVYIPDRAGPVMITRKLHETSGSVGQREARNRREG